MKPIDSLLIYFSCVRSVPIATCNGFNEIKIQDYYYTDKKLSRFSRHYYNKNKSCIRLLLPATKSRNKKIMVF